MKMRTMLLALIAGCAITSASLAGDLNFPVKAASAVAAGSPCQVATATTPLSCSGAYVGGGLGGSGSNADIIGSGINGSVFAGGMVPFVDLGYQYAKGNWFFAGESDLGYATGSAATIGGGGSNLNGLRLTEMVKLGGNLSGLLGTQQPISIPPQLAAAVIAPYVGVGQAQWQLVGAWANGNVGAAGVVFDIGPQWFGDLRYEYTSFDKARSQGILVNNDQSLKVSINHKFSLGGL